MYFCYLLNSRRTPTSKATYIGFSTQPIHRLRQHNGELVAGARKTSKYRPWIHIAIVAGFPNKITALQFEWQWQHPARTRIPGSVPVSKRSGYKRCLDDLVGLLSKGLWKQLNLNVLFPTEELMGEFQRLPGSDVTTVSLISPESFKPTAESEESTKQRPVTSAMLCTLCNQSLISDMHFWSCASCDTSFHVVCTAKHSSDGDSIVPERGTCSVCNFSYPWSEVVHKIRSKPTEDIAEDRMSIDRESIGDNEHGAYDQTDGQINTQGDVIDLMGCELQEENSRSESETHSYCIISSDEEAES